MFEKVRQVIAESLGIRESDVKLDSSFVSLGADSLEMAQLVLDLEEAFHIEILEDDLAKFLTVQDAVKYAEAQWLQSHKVPVPSAS